MKSREQEYREIFKTETLEDFDSISSQVVKLEKNPGNDALVHDIFRLLHNLKANAKAMEFLHLSELAHRLENVFSAIRDEKIPFTGTVPPLIYRALDVLEKFIQNIDKNDAKPVAEDEFQTLTENLERVLQAGTENTEEIYTGQARSENLALSELVHIPIRKLDSLLNLVGELMIDREQLIALGAELEDEKLKWLSARLFRITNEIQRSVMDARLVNIGFLFNKFPRIVRDIATVEKKEVDLVITGEDIKIDRNILQVITDAMLHLVRNAINHGLEPVEERKKLSKPAAGTITLHAEDAKDAVLLSISDDGRGIDPKQVAHYAVANEYATEEEIQQMNKSEVLHLIFEPGFSLSEKITEFSGRGVGLDVVKNSVDSMGGRLIVSSVKNKGTTFKLYLPISIAVKGALLMEVAGSFFAIPLIHIDSVVSLEAHQLHKLGQLPVADIKGETVSIFPVRTLFYPNEPALTETIGADSKSSKKYEVVILNYHERKVGFIVDKFLKQQDIVVKPLQKPVHNIHLFSGATLLGSGEVCLVIDVPALLKEILFRNKTNA